MSNILVEEILRELVEETQTTRKCLKRISLDVFDYKPNEKSFKMGTLAFIVADIPRWITIAAKSTELDFATAKHDEPKSTEDLVKFFDEHMKSAKTALENMSDEKLQETFYLKFNGQVVWESSKLANISSNLRHLVHHRGQLTVYMRLKDIPVPSIYGPSGDEKAF